MERLKNWQLEHVTPEEVGVNSKVITAFLNEINEKGLGLQSFTVVRHDKVCAQGFFAPYSADMPHVLYSMSKSVTSTAIGFAISEGLINLDDKVVDYFPEYVMSKRPFNRMLTIRMLLTMRSDKLITVLEEKGKTDWISNFLGATFLLPPNTKFNYISENTFMLSAIISKVTGMSMLDYLYPRVFEPLGIEKPFWETDGVGNNAGGWGLYMKSEDLAKFFLPYIHGGKWIDGTQIIPEIWVKEATKKQVDSVRDGFIDNMMGYGYQFWKNPIANSARADGLFGQRCFLFPDYDALVVLNCGEAEDYNVMKVFWKYFPQCFGYEALPENKEAYDEMMATINACAVVELPAGERNKEMEEKISGRLIKCKTSEFVSVITISITQMLYNKPGEINEMKLTFEEDKLRFYWREKEYENTIDVGLNGEYGISEITLGDLHYHTYSKAAWQEDGTLKLWIRPIETAHVRQFTFEFRDDDTVKIINEMTPRFQDLAIYNMTFTGHPIKGEITESVLKDAVEKLGLPFIEPDFKGKFED
ncbi:MAG: beta-lactamase family protein [Clostridium sp.]|nr:beta-lactamase family protein [Clostridium sp.]